MTCIRVLYFAGIRDLVGVEQESVRLPESVRNVAELMSFLERIHPELRGQLASVRAAVNETFADVSEPLTNDAVVALIPPVAGG